MNAPSDLVAIKPETAQLVLHLLRIVEHADRAAAEVRINGDASVARHQSLVAAIRDLERGLYY